MALITKIETALDLRREFRRFGREDQFSLEGYQAIIELFEELGGDVELDVIEICCDFTESSIDTFANDYRLSSDTNNPDSVIELVLDFIQNEDCWYQLIDNGTRIIYQCF